MFVFLKINFLFTFIHAYFCFTHMIGLLLFPFHHHLHHVFLLFLLLLLILSVLTVLSTISIHPMQTYGKIGHLKTKLFEAIVILLEPKCFKDTLTILEWKGL